MDLDTLLEHIDIGKDQDIEFKSAEKLYLKICGQPSQLLLIQMVAI
ncbi:MAG: hypothetical protein F6K22_20865 [Okeania sp. SIO2F4]|nr:hypothetical protein [Okeania sp. SIO2F4]NES05060.1 hypothetical protein [Okeania sp. SIO2F4]